MMLVLCTHKRSLAAWALRTILWSRWSHSAVYDEERGLVYDTTFAQGGVRATPASAFFRQYPTNELRPIYVPYQDKGRARVWLSAQCGKPYDWTALLSWIVRRDWAQDDSWFCSELTETFITLFANPRFRAAMSRITPAHQDMLI